MRRWNEWNDDGYDFGKRLDYGGINMRSAITYQLDLFHDNDTTPTHARFHDRSGAFGDNMSLPFHRWYRYSAGFSADWVRWLIRERRGHGDDIRLLDPFAGVGTSLLAADAEGVRAWGYESHPFVYRIACAKLGGINADIFHFHSLCSQFLETCRDVPISGTTEHPPLLVKCFTEDTLAQLMTMRYLFQRDFNHRTPESELLWLAITAILRECSGVGTAQWQYVLPNKSKANVRAPFEALSGKAAEMARDMEHARRGCWATGSRIIPTDARQPEEPPDRINMVVTSPPYPNNYDYADATRLEMTFWGEVAGWGDLQSVVRRHLIRSCSQHATAERLELSVLLSEDAVRPIRAELAETCGQLSIIRETKGGRKSYHTMAAAYFRDLALVFQSLRAVCSDGATVCFVIGDSAPYGIYLPVDEWLGKLAVAAGFASYRFEKIRDRNTKWKNRKHRVPLKEGRLWIEA